MKLLEISCVGQKRLGQGFEEDPFRVGGPTCAANDIKELGVVLLARKTGNCLFYFAELSLIHSPAVYRKPLYWAGFQLYTGS